MRLLRALIRNHPLANVMFAVVLVLGIIAYVTMPRAQDPEINFNWVGITTVLAGASAEDVERLVTNPLEDGIRGVADLRFVVSTSRENVSSMLVRFREISPATFDKRVTDLRREVQNKANTELPSEAADPFILEITTSNGFPTAQLLLLGQADDETLREAGRRIKLDLEGLAGVDQVYASGLRDPEILITPDNAALVARGLSATDVADAVRSVFRDTSAGTLKTQGGAWSVTAQGISTDPERLADIPVTNRARPGAGAQLGDVARIERAREPASQYASLEGRPAVSLAVTKKAQTNTLHLVDRLRDYIDQRNPALAATGLALVLSDDQTVPTREAIGVMESNALFGLISVLGICWLFLGWRVGVLVAIGIPFSLAGTLAILHALGHTLNISVLLGIVIALGMLVDDAVVVVEAIYYKVQRGMQIFDAAVEGVAEVFKPVLASVLTTMAAFLPLMLLPGIVGKFMFVIPFVVTMALLISLAEAFWMLPTHVTAINLRLDKPSRSQHWRNEFNRRIRLIYGKTLAVVLRRARWSIFASFLLVGGAVALFATGLVKVQFFAFDAMRIFYVNVDMPSQSTLEQTLAETEAVERAVRRRLEEGEARSVVSLAGLKFTETEPVYGDPYGQVTVSLNPRGDGREVADIVEAMRAEIEALPGPGRKTFTLLSGGPPAGKPINIKVRGDDYAQLRRATDAVKQLVTQVPGTKDVSDDDVPGRPKLVLNFDFDAVRNAGLDAAQLARLVRIQVDGEIVAFTREEGNKIEVRVRAPARVRDDPIAVLAEPLTLPNGQVTRLSALLDADVEDGKGFIRHYNFRRTIAVEANLQDPKDDPDAVNTQQANEQVQQAWESLRVQYPGVDLEFSGELEDIQESLDAMGVLFALGVGLIFLILATQFVSYWQPLMILVSVPLAFTGVTFGLALTRNPLSLFTMYGVIALAGIAVNSAIVLIDAANERRARGMSTLHAVVWAARRRVVPIIITSATTIGGLFALATGLGGKSLLWGPVAASIVWGLAFSTVLTLYVVPLLYLLFMGRKRRLRDRVRERWLRLKTR
ncbi:efflux RND transporter permease subunit [Piscinibacter sp.]|uniref:efflux RND transporter permease subunit n=1 Tax=Piscinibacter sp. TaxID=1903157 RepID=UPI002C38E6FC|nr:efflux RND transporter permease subunit [Albitalea sp.]HUG24167.1 efflux RND transporter permease subunit [Albitalea sp.]